MSLMLGKMLTSNKSRKIQTSFRRLCGRFEDRIYITIIDQTLVNRGKPKSITIGLDYLMAEQLSVELAQWAHAYKMQKLLADNNVRT